VVEHLSSNPSTEREWWCIPIISALEKLTQEDDKFQASLGSKNKKNEKELL
jgi:hypothetical protein